MEKSLENKTGPKVSTNKKYGVENYDEIVERIKGTPWFDGHAIVGNYLAGNSMIYPLVLA